MALNSIQQLQRFVGNSNFRWIKPKGWSCITEKTQTTSNYQQSSSLESKAFYRCKAHAPSFPLIITLKGIEMKSLKCFVSFLKNLNIHISQMLAVEAKPSQLNKLPQF